MTTSILTQAGFINISFQENEVFATVSGMPISAAINELPKAKMIEIGDLMPEQVDGCKYLGNGRIFKAFKHKARKPFLSKTLEDSVEIAKLVAKPRELVKFYRGNLKIATMQNGIVEIIENPIPELL